MRLESNPVTERCGVPYAAVLTNAWVSIRNGRALQCHTDGATRQGILPCCDISISEGLVTSRSPRWHIS